MKRWDGLFLGAVFVLSALGFLLPGLRTAHWHGVALFGWWMAALMFLGPLAAFVHMVKEKK